MACKGELSMKETCYFQVSCLQQELLLQLFKFGSYVPVALDGGTLSRACKIDAFLRNCFAYSDEISKLILR